MNEYMIRYVDYETDRTRARYVIARTIQDALNQFKDMDIKYWRIVDIIMIRENVE